MFGVNYRINGSPLQEQLHELNNGGKTLLQLLLKVG